MKKIKKRTIIWAVVGVVVLLGTAVALLSQRKISKEAAIDHFEDGLSKQEFNQDYTATQWSIDSGKLGLKWSGGKGTAKGGEVTKETPFHTASIGKLFTAVLTYQAAEKGLFSLEDPIDKYLPGDILENLFVFEGQDYSGKVTVRQLLSHTSGVADYFEDPVTGGKTMAELLKENPDKLWTPDELIDFTRDYQQAVGTPGEKYHYTDTGYMLLGKLLEATEKQSFNTLLRERLFKPLGMSHTTLLFDENNDFQYTGLMTDVWLNGDNYNQTNGLSVDWSGGGVVTTTSDLITFSKALHGKKLISDASYALLFKGDQVFRQGIYYGGGGMTLHFEEFFFLLRGLPQMKGHIGVLSTHIFYDETTDTHIALNFGSTSQMENSFKTLIDMVMTLRQVDPEL